VTPQERAQALLAQLLEPGASRSGHSPLWVHDEVADTRHAHEEARSLSAYWYQLRRRKPYTAYRSAWPILTPVPGDAVFPLTLADTSAVAELEPAISPPYVRRKLEDVLTGASGAATSDDVCFTASNLGR
jgi:hypothetical protein